MLGEYLFNESSAMYCTSVLLVDHGVESRAEYAYAFERPRFHRGALGRDDLGIPHRVGGCA